MTSVLVVDDSAVDRRLAGGLLKKHGLAPIFASNGLEALSLVQQNKPDLVVTDLHMPELDGLELVEAIRQKFPDVPVVLMTAHGSEEIAVRALQKGAASYVPKRNLAEELATTVANLLELTRTDRQQQRVLDCLTQTESHFVLDNDLGAIPALVGHLEANLVRMKLCDGTGLIQVAVALREALVNAMIHGNLELTSELREYDERGYWDLAERRRSLIPYRDRRVHITSKETRSEATYVILDEGPGFDPASLPDPTDPANLERVSGRGLMLIRTFMDAVTHNERGNAITMVKRRDRAHSIEPPPSSMASSIE